MLHCPNYKRTTLFYLYRIIDNITLCQAKNSGNTICSVLRASINSLVIYFSRKIHFRYVKHTDIVLSNGGKWSMKQWDDYGINAVIFVRGEKRPI